MKITKTANGKIRLSQRDWFRIGKKAGWLSKEASPFNEGTITVTLYRDEAGTISVMEDDGMPFDADVTYEYEYYRGDPPLVTDIVSVTDSQSGEPVPIDEEVILTTFAEKLYESAEQQEIGKQEAKWEERWEARREEGF